MSSRLTMKPPRSWATMTRLPSFSPSALVSARVWSLVAMVRTTSSSFITGAGLKKWVPMTRSGRCVARAISMIGSDEVLLDEDGVLGHDLVEAAEQLHLVGEAFDDRLDHQVAVAQLAEVGAEAQLRADPLHVVVAELAAGAAALERPLDPLSGRRRAPRRPPRPPGCAARCARTPRRCPSPSARRRRCRRS